MVIHKNCVVIETCNKSSLGGAKPPPPSNIIYASGTWAANPPQQVEIKEETT